MSENEEEIHSFWEDIIDEVCIYLPSLKEDLIRNIIVSCSSQTLCNLRHHMFIGLLKNPSSGCIKYVRPGSRHEKLIIGLENFYFRKLQGQPTSIKELESFLDEADTLWWITPKDNGWGKSYPTKEYSLFPYAANALRVCAGIIDHSPLAFHQSLLFFQQECSKRVYCIEFLNHIYVIIGISSQRIGAPNE